MCILVFADVAYDFGKSYAGFDESNAEDQIKHLREDNARLTQQLTDAQGEITRIDRQSQIDRASYNDLTTQVKSLSDDNAALKDDLAFFETLMPANGKEGVTLSRFKVEGDALPGEYRYHLLLLQTGARAHNFQGRMQFVVNLQQNGKDAIVTLPAENEAKDAYQLNFRFYQRIDNVFHVAQGAVVKSVQVRVFDAGSNVPKLTQDVSVTMNTATSATNTTAN